MHRIIAGFTCCFLLTANWIIQGAERPHVVLITIDGFPARMFWDPKAPIPRIRELAGNGVSAEALHVANPTVTWPNHTTLVTGVRAARHSVLYNGRLLRGGPRLPAKVEPKSDQAELVGVPTLFDVLHEAGLRSSAIDWPCTRNATALEDNFPDVPDNALHTTPELRKELVAKGILANETDASFRALTGPGRDEVWTQATCHVLRTRHPDFLALHLLNTDGIHHRYGPESPASYTALALADFYVGQVLDTLDETGLRTSTTLFIVADHGFASATNVLQPNVLLRQAGLLHLGATNQILEAQAHVIPEGGTSMVYLTDPFTRDADRQKVIELFQGKPGIAQIIEPRQFAELGWPVPSTNPQAPDLILAAQDGYAFNGTATGDAFLIPVTGSMSEGYHGYLASNSKMNALFVAAGRGIRRRQQIGTIENVDIAPTIAHLFGKSLPNAEGKVLTEILEP